MQVYLTEALYRQLKRRRLHASHLLQEGVLEEIRRQDLSAEADRYVTELVAEVGEPSTDARSWARAIARGIQRPRSVVRLERPL
jgi:hypothetical protein